MVSETIRQFMAGAGNSCIRNGTKTISASSWIWNEKQIVKGKSNRIASVIWSLWGQSEGFCKAPLAINWVVPGGCANGSQQAEACRTRCANPATTSTVCTAEPAPARRTGTGALHVPVRTCRMARTRPAI
eukprot:scaffold404193_cov37-Prasinocladus_malaysianus.AAC.1